MKKESFYVLTYPLVKPTGSGDSLWHESHKGKYVSIDHHSGGYPYPVDSVVAAFRFETLEKALEYRRHWEWMNVWRIDAEPVAVKCKDHVEKEAAC